LKKETGGKGKKLNNKAKTDRDEKRNKDITGFGL